MQRNLESEEILLDANDQIVLFSDVNEGIALACLEVRTNLPNLPTERNLGVAAWTQTFDARGLGHDLEATGVSKGDSACEC